ncbi:MAG: hypothetical protein H0X57_08010 [Rubrobacter sp.]|nr:hypothetical protein [Rubrobacter sp.]
MKVSSFAVSAFALMLILAGFVAGWTLGYQQPPVSPEQEVARDVNRRASTTAEPTMPSEDVSGDDFSGLPRYPGSVRIEHAREDLGGLVATEVEYLTPTGLDTVREFYRDVFRTEDWNVADVSFSEGAWTFFVTQDGREVFVEIKPYGGLTEVDFELTEPKPREDLPKEPEKKEPQEEPPREEPPAEEQRAPEPSREPGPEPPAPVWSPPPASSPASPAPASSARGSASPAPEAASPAPPPAPSSAPAYDDDDDDDGFEDFDDDDGAGEDD